MELEPNDLSQLVLQGRSRAKAHSYSSLNLRSGIERLDQTFRPLWSQGGIIEWGLPLGRNGRPLLLAFFRELEDPLAWVYGHKDLNLQPSAWSGQGVDLDRFFYIQSSRPIVELRPLFLERVFSLIVLDNVEGLGRSDFSFMASQARKHGFLIFVLRNFFLSQKKGNPFAKARFNIDYKISQRHYQLDIIKGFEEQRLRVEVDELRRK